MSFISNIISYVILVFFAAIVAVLIVGAVVLYLLKFKKIMAREESIDYSKFDRTDVLDYLRFDDIIEAGYDEDSGFGIICKDQVYTAGMDIQGYNFSQASEEEKRSTMLKAIAFAGIIKDDIQLRQTVQAIKLEDNINEHKKIFKECQKELNLYDELYQETLRKFDDAMDDEELAYRYSLELDDIQRQIGASDFLSREADALMACMKALQERSQNQVTNQLFFSYVYNPSDFSSATVDENGVRQRAIQALKTKFDIYSRALAKCGCKCKPLSAINIASSMYDYMHPFNQEGDRFTQKYEESLNTLFVSSNTLDEYSKRIKDREEYQRVIDEQIKRHNEEVRMGDIDFIRTLRSEYLQNNIPVPDEYK